MHVSRLSAGPCGLSMVMKLIRLACLLRSCGSLVAATESTCVSLELARGMTVRRWRDQPGPCRSSAWPTLGLPILLINR
jgi:hypothetical protein